MNNWDALKDDSYYDEPYTKENGLYLQEKEDKGDDEDDIADEVSCDPEFEERQRDIEADRVEMAIDDYQENKGDNDENINY